MNKKVVNKIVNSREFVSKVASMQEKAAPVGSLSTAMGVSGDTMKELVKVAVHVGMQSYRNRRTRAVINSGIISLSEVQND